MSSRRSDCWRPFGVLMGGRALAQPTEQISSQLAEHLYVPFISTEEVWEKKKKKNISF